MNINDQFPSKYLRASDLQGHDAAVTIASVTTEDVGGSDNPTDVKPVIYFSGKNKGLILNKTNANTISKLHGPETDAWLGKAITVYPTETEFRGEMVTCLRVRLNAPSLPATQPAQPVQPAQQSQQVSPVSSTEQHVENTGGMAAALTRSVPGVGAAPVDDAAPISDDDIPF